LSLSERARDLLGARPAEIYADPEKAWSRMLALFKTALV